MPHKKRKRTMPSKKRKSAKKSNKSKNIVSNYIPVHKFSKSLLILFVLAVAALGVKLTFFSHAAGFVVKHPQAAVQPTTIGQAITALKSWNGKLYAGYGDYNANTGPITINAFDGSNFASSTSDVSSIPPCASVITNPQTCKSDTEAIYGFRENGGKLFAVSIDPRANSNYAFATPAGSGTATWQNPAGFAEHAFDVITLNGSDLWLTGSAYKKSSSTVAYNDVGAVWCSPDGGNTWVEALTLGPLPVPYSGYTGYNFTRFYGAGVYNGKLYTQATDYPVGPQPTSKVFTSCGQPPTDGPQLPTFRHAETFANKMVYIANQPGSPGPLQAFDGSIAVGVNPPNTGSIYDFTIDGDAIYVLSGRTVYKSTDLNSWSSVANVARNARSLAIYQGALWVGSTDSSLYKYDLTSVSTRKIHS